MVSVSQNSRADARVGIIAGQGNLPLALATSLRASGQLPFLLLVEGEADPADYQDFPFDVFKITKIGRFLKALKREGCTKITLAGPVRRPDMKNIVPDFEGVKLLARITASIGKGDDQLLTTITTYLADKGYEIVGVHELATDLLVPTGQLGRLAPEESDWEDIREGSRIVKAIGELDIGQAAIIRDGYTLAVEAAEGTDGLLERSVQFAREQPSGVLVKLSKPGQDLRIDMPTIGPGTISRAAAANLRGIAVEAERTLVMEKSEMIVQANAAGIFVIGLELDVKS